MTIPQDKIDEIRERINIVEIISEYVSLKKSGKNHTGLCPFHSEKTPSFTVNDEKQIFYCFGCNTGGNAFTFLMRQENLSFPEAIRTLARKAGIDIPQDRRPTTEENQRELMFLANHAASEYYHQYLLTAPDAEKARLYIKGRGLKPETIKSFKIGYAPPGRNTLSNFLIKKGTSLELAEKAGLINRHGNNNYDRFKNRVMFPISDTRGRVIGFGGRAMGNEEPKYLNSPTSPLFKKGEVVYGMHQAKGPASAKGFVLVVEGYFDLLMLHQYGFSNAVATLGTALTTEHIRKLKGYTKEIYTLFDSDKAGIAAAMRSLPMFVEEGMRARVVIIPADMDPDEILVKKGAAVMAEYIQDAKPVMDFFLGSLRAKFNTNTSGGKLSFLEEAAPYIAAMKNVAERGIYIEKIAGMLHIGPDVILSTIRAAAEPAPRKGMQQHTPPASEIISKGHSTKAEETILKVILAYPKLYTESVGSAVEMFKTDFLKEAGKLIVDSMGKANGGKIELSHIVDLANSENTKNWLLKASVEEDESIKEEPKKILEDCCKKVLMDVRLKKDRTALLKTLKESEKKGDMDSFKTAAESYLSIKRGC